MKKKFPPFDKLLLIIYLLTVGVQAAAQEMPEATLIKLATDYYYKNDANLCLEYSTRAINKYPASSAAYNTRGLCYINALNYAAAITDFDKAIQLAPRFTNAMISRGYTYYKMGNAVNASKDYKAALLLEPGNATALNNLAILLYSQKNYTEAIDYYTKLVYTNATAETGYSGRGNCYYGLTKYDRAITEYTNAIKLAPNNYNYFFNRGDCYYYSAQYDLALADYTKSIEINPKAAASYASRGNCYDVKGYLDKAIAEYTEALRIDPSYGYAYGNRGILYYRRSSFDKALLDFNEAVRLGEKTAALLTYRGNTYTSIDNFTAALNDFSEALQLDPAYSDALVGRGYLYTRQEQFDKAIEDNTAALRIAPKNAYAFINRALAYDGKGLSALALADYNEAIRLGPTKEIYFNRAYYHYSKGNADLAIADYNRAIEIDNRDVSSYRGRAAAFVLKGDYQKAVPDYMEAFRINPDDASTYDDYFTLCTHTGDITSAKEYLKKYRERNVQQLQSSSSWKFYSHYLTALMDGVLADNYDLAIKELKVAEQSYSNENATSHKQASTKYGYVDILFLQGYVLEKLERNDEAKVAYEQALVINDNQPDVKQSLARLATKKAVAITTDKLPPTVEIISPQPSRSFDIVSDEGSTQIIGRAKDAGGIRSVTINGKAVQRLEEDGLFIDERSLAAGDNILNVEVADKNNNKTTQAFTIKIKPKAEEQQNAQSVAAGAIPSYHAILIAEQDYEDKNIPDLKNPVKDARELKNILETIYTFDPKNIDTLFNASRKDILQTIVQKSKSLGENDNLLIFYAGHGTAEKDKFGAVEGYWIPTSAVKDDKLETYISADLIKKSIQASISKHILIIADACYSGSFTRSVLSNATLGIQKQFKMPSRKIMTSGNMEPVPDISRFIYYLKQYLKENSDKYMTAEKLFDSFKEAIRNNSETDPQYAAITGIGDEGGQFVFIKK